MDLTIDNKVETKNKVDNEVSSFINELGKSLEKNADFQTTITNEIYEEIPLATKYKEQLQNIVDECMKDMSYERNFCYFDYDKKGNSYFLDYYSDGNIERVPITKEEMEESKLEKGMFFSWRDDGHIVESDGIKEGTKIDVESKLKELDRKIKNKR
jgi:hypothetical protein